MTPKGVAKWSAWGYNARVMRFAFIGYLMSGLLLLGMSACRQQDVPEEIVPEAVSPVTNGTKVVRKSASRSGAASTSSYAKPSAEQVARDKAAAAQIVPRRPGLRVSRVQAPGMYVALTFDDGPSSAYTPKVLDILKRHGAHATFFVLGSNARRCSSIVQRAAAEGHEIGVHTWSHINMARSSMAKIDSEVGRSVEVIRGIIGKSPVVMRPPYGATTTKIVNHMFDTYGMRSIMWDVDTQDWRRPGVSTVVRRAVEGAKPGSIILVHDIHASTLASIEGIVTGLQARGFKLVTVSELMARAGAAPAPQPAVTVPAVAEETVTPAPEQPAAETPETPAVAPVEEPEVKPAVEAVHPVLPPVSPELLVTPQVVPAAAEPAAEAAVVPPAAA